MTDQLLAAEAPRIDLTVPIISGTVVWLICAGVGAWLARSRGSSVVVGVLMPLFCGPLGLFFVTRLPTRDELPENKRRASLLPPSDIDVPKPIDPEIAKKLGLPPQRTGDGSLVSPPAAPPPAPTGFQPGGYQPGAYQPGGFQPGADRSGVAPPAVPTLPSFGSMNPAVAPVAPPVAPAAPPPQPVGGFWANDPTGRFARRWWDGTAWTARVAGPDGVEGIDPSA